MTVQPVHSRRAVVTVATEGDRAEWDAFVRARETSSVYHWFSWRRIFGETFGYGCRYLIARDESGAMTGCLPLFVVSSPASRRLVAVPFRDRGGAVWDSPESLAALLEKAKEIAESERAAYVEIKSIAGYPDALVGEQGFTEHRYWVRSAIDLRPFSRERYWKEIGAKTRNMIRQAESSGLTFSDETDRPDVLKSWYRLFLQTQKRNGVPPFPYRFFERMLAGLREHGAIRIFTVRHSGQPISATIVFLHRKSGIYAYSASSRAAQQFRPNDFMLFNTAMWLLDGGYEEFDLGSDAPSQESLLFFKKKWMAEQTVIPAYTHGRFNSADADSSAPRYRLARRAVQYLPDPMLRMLGSMTCKYFG